LILALKKTLCHPKADPLRRTEFQRRIQQYQEEGKTIVYVDESGFAYDMPRTRGYSLKGERCYGSRDWHARGRQNAIGALIERTLLTVCLFDSTVNSDVFYAWLTQDLLPKTPPASVVVMDNATFHKREDMKEAIGKQGHILEYLPPYSPDLNPIEKKWAQAKSIRKKKRCGISELFSYI